MSDDPYKPPEARVDGASAGTLSIGPEDVLFFPVEKNRLIIMSIFSVGLYVLYWFYKNWVLYKERTGKNISPVLRTIFAPVTAYYIFIEIVEKSEEISEDIWWSAGLMALAYFLINACNVLPSFGLHEWFSWIALFSFVPVMYVNDTAAIINQRTAPEHEHNDKLTLPNFLWIIIGGTLLIFAFIGTFFRLPS